MADASDPPILLFSYGTLRLPQVQRATFGRLVAGEHDAILGYRVETIRIQVPNVVGLSGTETHLILVASGNSADSVEGQVFLITQAELEAADAYETDDYVRVEAPLRSGRRAFVYVSPAS